MSQSLANLATPKRPIALITQKKNFLRVDLIFEPDDSDTFDVEGTDFEQALQKIETDYDVARSTEHVLRDNPTDQRAWFFNA